MRKKLFWKNTENNLFSDNDFELKESNIISKYDYSQGKQPKELYRKQLVSILNYKIKNL